MFVRQSKYDALHLSNLVLTVKHETLVSEHNRLVDKINEKGGEEFLQNGSLKSDPTFTQKELKVLSRLVHPDKHKNSNRSVEAFAHISGMIK